MEVRPGYKQTELGVIPKDWSVKKLGELGEPLIGLTYKPSNVKSDGLLVLRSSNVEDGALRFDDNVFVDMDVPKKIIARKGDILICVRNGSRDLIGKCAKIDDRAQGMTFGAFMAVLRTPFHDFVYYQFQSEVIQRQIHEHLGATINQITNKSLRSFRIPFPEDDAEQRAIATALGDVDELLGAMTRLIAKKRDLKQAAMQQLLTGQIRLLGFNGEWEVKRFGELFQFLSTANNPRSDLSEFGDVGYIHYGDIHTNSSAFLDCATEALPMISKAKVASISTVEDGDLVMADASEDYEGIGKSREVRNVGDRKIVAGLHTFLLRGNREVLSGGFRGYLQFIPSVKAALVRLATGISVYGISKTSVKSIQVLMPETREQSAIAAVLSDMDAEIVALEDRLAKTRALKQRMMQELLTGRIRLV